MYPSNLPKLNFYQDHALGSESHSTGEKGQIYVGILLTEWIEGDKETSSEREGGRSCDSGGSAMPLESQGVYLGSIWVFDGALGDLCNLQSIASIHQSP
jgi:hypothetical protein